MGLKKTITGEKENAEAGAWENQQPQRCEEEGAWENIIQYTIVKEKDSLTSKTIKKTKRHQQQQKENPPPATTDHHQNRRKKKRHRIKGRRSTYRRKGTGEKEEEEAHMKELNCLLPIVTKVVKPAVKVAFKIHIWLVKTHYYYYTPPIAKLTPMSKCMKIQKKSLL